jgi:hypothetical protein
MKTTLNKIAQLFIEKYPLKSSIDMIAADWDYFFLIGLIFFLMGLNMVGLKIE